ncbi:MAG: hypothetical protein AB7G13_29365 [Lautropia sp.]
MTTAREVAGALLVIAGIIATPPVVAEDALGRLFLTPAERRAIDAARQAPADAPAMQAPSTVPPPDPSRVDGVVRRSLGPDVVWIDGRPTVLSADGGATAPRIEADHVVLPTADGRWLRLRPGPSIDGAGRVAGAVK